MRVFAIPLGKARWTLLAEQRSPATPPVLATTGTDDHSLRRIPSIPPSSPSSSARPLDSSAAVTVSPLSLASNLLNDETMQRWRDRAAAIQQRVENEWQEMASSPKRSWKRRVHATGSRLLDRVCVNEDFFKAVPEDALDAEVVYPLGADEQELRDHFATLLNNHTALHRRWLLASLGFLPFTAAASLFPGPNFFLIWNSFRVYSHHRASKGVARFAELVKDDKLIYRPCAELAELCPVDRSHRTLTAAVSSTSGSTSSSALSLDELSRYHSPLARAVRRTLEQSRVGSRFTLRPPVSFATFFSAPSSSSSSSASSSASSSPSASSSSSSSPSASSSSSSSPSSSSSS
eukprot:CAMPEP_0174234462 /NCGR_PEP_ID=MMETSP0417-20130205/4207_1 /TAXON_ID=242541 /ORGANISM="Mayorella sp, Strain BSH-02190019" /LENGTH=347 /DNA_ID=CAMNT_0015312827 /DNA_START=66 /DNA_END=1109 /DNA_ORIENTATION=-